MRRPGHSESGEVVAEPIAVSGVAQLGEGFLLDLSDSFPGHAEELADLVEGAGFAVDESEPQP